MDVELPKKSVTLLHQPAGAATPTWKKEQAEQYHKMHDELKGQLQPKKEHKAESAHCRPAVAKEKLDYSSIDIFRISAAAFQLNLWKKENTLFVT